jgi:hypothetical protein
LHVQEALSMTDHQKLLCTLLGKADDRTRDGVRRTVSPMRVVSVLLVRRDIGRRGTA